MTNVSNLSMAAFCGKREDFFSVDTNIFDLASPPTPRYLSFICGQGSQRYEKHLKYLTGNSHAEDVRAYRTRELGTKSDAVFCRRWAVAKLGRHVDRRRSEDAKRCAKRQGDNPTSETEHK